MKKTVTMTITETLFSKLYDHLFPGDDDEHGAVISVGISESDSEVRLLAREIFLAEDGIDYVPGTYGYRALTAEFVNEKADYCFENNLGYIAVHCHGGDDYVQFSGDDIRSHKRGYPALLEITGGPVGALVFAANAVAGEIWTSNGIFELDHLTIIGSRVRKLYPSPNKSKIVTDPIYDRHARIFGDIGQSILSNLKVAIIGAGGGGSLLNEWISRLGVGNITTIDYDKVEPSNLPRIVGATRWDAQYWLQKSRYQFLKNIGKQLSKYKVNVAKRVAKKANPKVRYQAIVGDILDEETALKLKNADFVFLASDSIKSRNVFNYLVHQYLIPGAQIGAKVRVDPDTKQIIEIHSAGRMVIPQEGGGCLFCNGWIPPGRLQKELLSDDERRAQNYVEDETVTEPSVITLNVLSASQVINDFMMMFTGLYPSGLKLNHQVYYIMERDVMSADLINDPSCLVCSTTKKSKYAKGDRARLPCRLKAG